MNHSKKYLNSCSLFLFVSAFGGILINASDADAQRSSSATKPAVTTPTPTSTTQPSGAAGATALSPNGVSCPSMPNLAQAGTATSAAALTAPPPNTVVVTEKANAKAKKGNPFGGLGEFLKKNSDTIGLVGGWGVSNLVCPRLIQSGALPGITASDCGTLIMAAGAYLGTELKKEFDMQDSIKIMSARSKAIETGQPQRIQLSKNRAAVMEVPIVVTEGKPINVFHSTQDVPISSSSVGVELNRLVTKETKLLSEPKDNGRQLALLANECPVRVVGFDKEATDFALVANGPVVLGYVAAADIAKEGRAAGVTTPTPVPVPAKGKAKTTAPRVVAAAQPRVPAGYSPRTLTTVRCNRETIQTTSGETGEVKNIVQTICEDPAASGGAFGSALRL
jgi:hypothetical protein